MTATRALRAAACLAALAAAVPVAGLMAQEVRPAPASAAPASAIFLHPDGMGANTWHLARLVSVGPDGRLAWDRMERAAVYVGAMTDAVTQSSNGGATTHAWGVRSERDSYGMIARQPIPRAASGAPVSLMMEAKAAGKAIGIVNSSSVTEPGTGAFLASVPNRRDEEAIAAQILASGADVILGGGEQFFLPRGVTGVHGTGVRTDGRNLIEEARAAGYTVVRTAAELEALPPSASRVLGLFAREETFNEGTEQQLAARRLPVFQPQAPRFDVMIARAITILSRHPQGFFLVGNEEATDNLGGDNNAAAVIEGALGADRAIATALAAAAANPNLTVVVSSDSDCGAAQANDVPAGRPVPVRGETGAPQDGNPRLPFLTAPDARGQRLPFAVSWGSGGDVAGGLVVRAHGPGAAALSGTVDSSGVYTALHRGLFGAR
jgi:alkaline phosphatase